MKNVLTKNFHTIERLRPNQKKVYILATWRPKKDIYLIGASIGLLCCKSDFYEIYLSISKSPRLTPKKFFVGLKKDYLFYGQRDVYTYSTSIKDLVDYIFLPEGHGFFIKKNTPLYIKVGAHNGTQKSIEYDAFCNIYYTPADQKQGG
jgi:hypothetical protein